MLSYFGHIARDGGCLEECHHAKTKLEVSRKPGRPRTTWIGQIKSLARSSSLQELYSLVTDRHRWQATVDLTSC